jgi:D-alanyl-D-alanine carboxypeptidase
MGDSGTGPAGQGPQGALAFYFVRSGKRKSFINLLAAAKRKRRRDRRLVVALILVSVLVLGYSFTEAKQAKVWPVIQPTIRQGPQVAEVGEIGIDKHLNIERAKAAQVTSLPAPEESCDDLRVLVDRSHTLPPDYVPEDLVPLWAYGIPTLGSGEMLLRREAAEHLSSLVSEAAADGEELVVASAYRSYADQQASHARLASIYGTDAGEMSALPGHSQHQLGTAVDFTNAAAGYELWQPFGYTSASQWLLHHAPEHGFVLAYPYGQETETGYQWEPWHYRYVGTRNAVRLAESGLSLQEFLAREGVKPRC